MRRLRVLSCMLVVGLAGCSVLTDYPSRTRCAQRAFGVMDFDRAAAEFEDKETGLDRLCYLAERGTVLHTAGRFDESNALFEDAFGVVQEFDSRATVSVRDSAAFVGTLLINEKTEPYRGESFERVYIHTFSAMNYLLKGDRSGARVEIRRAYNRQTKERLAHQAEYDEARRQSESRQVYRGDALAQARQAYGGHESLAKVNIFQDAFSFHLSSLVYELQGEYNDALVDAKKVLVLKPASLLAKQQAVRCAKRVPGLGAGGLIQQYGDVPAPASGEGEVVVLFACGLAPEKREIKIALPIPSGRGWTYNKIAFPIYRERPNPVTAARITVGGRSLGRTEVLSDVERKAKATLYQRLPVLVMKSVLRAVTRYAAQKTILDSGHRDQQLARHLIAFGVGLATAAVEQADLRSWLTLPQSFQAARGAAPAGSQAVTVELVGRHGAVIGASHHPIEVQAGRTTVVVVRSVGPCAKIWSAGPF